MGSADVNWRNWRGLLKFAVKRSKGRGMSISAQTVRCDDETLWVDLADGRTIGALLAWFPRLMRASAEERAGVRISPSGRGLHWEKLDEDISLEGLLAGRGDQTEHALQAGE